MVQSLRAPIVKYLQYIFHFTAAVPHVLPLETRRAGRPRLHLVPPPDSASESEEEAHEPEGEASESEESMEEFEPVDEKDNQEVEVLIPIILPQNAPPPPETGPKCIICINRTAYVAVDNCSHYGFCVKCIVESKLNCPHCRGIAPKLLAPSK